MKKLLLLLLAGLFIQSCSKKNESEVELTGSWNLVEIYADPGDGSGDFESVESDKTIEFLSDKTVISNGTLCTMEMGTDHSSGSYDPESGYIYPENCTSPNARLTYKIVNGKLEIGYLCVEACVERYIKN
jgi:hypothetical protein